MVWLVRELVKSAVLGADGVCMTFMKQIAGELDGRSAEARDEPRGWAQAVEGSEGPGGFSSWVAWILSF